MKTIKVFLLIAMLISIFCFDSKAQYHRTSNSPITEVKVETITANGITYFRSTSVNEQFIDSFEWQQAKRQRQIELDVEQRQQDKRNYINKNRNSDYNEPKVESLFKKANGMSLVDEINKITNDTNKKYGIN